MIILLPAEGRFAEIEPGFTAVQVESIVAALQPADIALTLPKFSFDTEFNLGNALTGLGMTHALDSDMADFSGIYDRSQEDGNLNISHILHKTVISVEEMGAEAAAATGVVFREVLGLLNQFTIDRPFLLIILIPIFPEKIVYIALFSCYNVL
jgi:serpin B